MFRKKTTKLDGTVSSNLKAIQKGSHSGLTRKSKIASKKGGGGGGANKKHK
jgi:hypothetical protein